MSALPFKIICALFFNNIWTSLRIALFHVAVVTVFNKYESTLCFKIRQALGVITADEDNKSDHGN